MVLGSVIIMKLENHTANPNLFFDMLPTEWQDLIVPYWDNLILNAKLYVLAESDNVVAGGLVFSKCPPDMMYYEREANEWFKKGYLYLGYIFVDESQRHRHLGSLWLDKIKDEFPKQGLWLSIEDASLHKFYDKNGFKRVATIMNGDSEEGIYVYEPSN